MVHGTNMLFESFWFYKVPVEKLNLKRFLKETQNVPRGHGNSLKTKGADRTLVSPVFDGFFILLLLRDLVVSFAALALRDQATNDTTWAQINNIPEKSHVIIIIINT